MELKILTTDELERLVKEPDGNNHCVYMHDVHIAEAQAKLTAEQVSTEVGEVLCSLVGNTMLEDMEKGKWLGEKLTSLFKALKGIKDE